MQSSPTRRLIWPSVLLALTFTARIIWGEKPTVPHDWVEWLVYYGIGTATGLAVAWWTVRLLDLLLWRTLERRLNSKIPRLLKEIATVFVLILCAIAILDFVFERSMTSIWATSGFVGLALGFALKNVIMDVLSGIVINVDQPFKLGHWIRLCIRVGERIEGRVIEINWRSTRIQTNDETMIVVPNSIVSSSVLNNFSAPESRSRFEISIHLDGSVAPDTAICVILRAVREIKGPIDPQVMVDSVHLSGVEYKVRYGLDTSEISPRRGRHLVISSILRHLESADIQLACPRQELYLNRKTNPAKMKRGRFDPR